MSRTESEERRLAELRKATYAPTVWPTPLQQNASASDDLKSIKEKARVEDLSDVLFVDEAEVPRVPI